MSKFYVVSVNRDCWRYPKLTIVIEAHVASRAEGKRFITEKVMSAFEKRLRGKMGRWPSVRIKDLRIVDDVGLKRLQAAAKASVTVRRKRAAKKAAATRAKKQASAVKAKETRLMRSYPPAYPVHADLTVN